MMKAYPEYKNSGFEWLGEVPEHWELRRLGTHFFERSEKVNDTDYPALSVTKLGIVPQLENVAKTDANDNRKKVVEGDFVINSRSDRKGSSGISDYNGSVSLISIVLEPRNFSSEYAHHLFRSYNFQEEFYRYGSGIVADLWSTRFTDMKGIYIPVMPLEEQHKIARYLDKETVRIDSLISEKQNFIKLLQEKRQALISHVVTKGLNPNVEMKDSGVEWIGEIPEHWVAKKLKHCLSIKNGQDYKEVETEKIEGSYPVYGSGGEFRRATDYLYDGESVLLGRKGTIDKPMYVNEKFWTVDTMFYSKIHNNSDGKFLYYLSTTLPFGFYQTKTALPSMTQGDLLNHPIAVPDKLEQIKIREYIDAQCEKFDYLKAEVLNSVGLLKEHRTALISAAVTGKIDVREVA